ncbi:Yip1 family protein [Halomonas koreensis]|uniref:Yip1 family protein n=1 Tax=Halomonas koreensis TaxID=245385 RepID=A0ABU1G5C3_9GAMM|nr:Yip1 family protein [Halomonas koreensis]MDR5868135.1 Yip1 family protein [Halomonas koreensis]
MSPLVWLRLPFSTPRWDALREQRPPLNRLILGVVAPLSLVPPLMLYYAGTHHGDALLAGFGDKSWRFITTILFLAELLTFAVMGGLIHQIANSGTHRLALDDAYRLAALAPVPLWLSPLGLVIPSLTFNAALALGALALSCGIVYHGLRGLGRIPEDVEAMSITYAVMAVGVMAWGLLLAMVWAF